MTNNMAGKHSISVPCIGLRVFNFKSSNVLGLALQHNQNVVTNVALMQQQQQQLAMAGALAVPAVTGAIH